MRLGVCRCVALACLSSTVGCGPEIPSSWQIVDVLDLGMRVEVAELGGLGDPGDPRGRSFHEAMPLDRVRASVMVAGLTGPLPVDELSFAWFVCWGTSCTEDLPPTPCPPEGIAANDECSLGISPEASLIFADFESLTDALALVSGFTIRAIGGRVSDGGARACLDRLERNVDLGSCMIVETYYPLGSVGELIALAESRGYVGADEAVPDTARQFPRNRVPAIDRLDVMREDTPAGTVEPGGSLVAKPGEVLTFTWKPTAVDREEVMIVGEDGTTLEYIDPLAANWWTTQEADAFDYLPGTLRLRWEVGPDEGRFPLYVVVTDGANASGWASFDVEVTR